MRKSPIRHPVRGHTREGKTIGPYSRGSGKGSQRVSRVVGNHSVIRDRVNKVWSSLMNAESTSVPLRFVAPDSTLGEEYRGKEGSVFATHDPYRSQISVITWSGWSELTEDEMAHILSHELVELKTGEGAFNRRYGIKDTGPLWHISEKFDKVQLDVLKRAGYDWSTDKFRRIQETTLEKMYSES